MANGIDFSPTPWPNVIGGLSQGISQGMGMASFIQQQKAQAEQIKIQKMKDEYEQELKNTELLSNLITSKTFDSFSNESQVNYINKYNAGLSKLIGIDVKFKPGDFQKNKSIKDYAVRVQSIYGDKNIDVKTKTDEIRKVVLEGMGELDKEGYGRLESQAKSIFEQFGTSQVPAPSSLKETVPEDYADIILSNALNMPVDKYREYKKQNPSLYKKALTWEQLSKLKSGSILDQILAESVNK